MAYANYDFYRDCYYGELLTEENAARWLDRASDELDALTFGRIVSAMPTDEAHTAKIRKATCAIAEALFRIDEETHAMGAQRAQDGSYHGAVSSVSSGRESVTYAQNGAGATSFASAAADESTRRVLIGDIAAKYLAGIPDANGVNLLYAGVG